MIRATLRSMTDIPPPPPDQPGALRQPPLSAQLQQPAQPDASTGVQRRSVVKTLSVGIGITAVGALGGAGAWWATHRDSANADDGTSPRPFSMAAPDEAFLHGTHEAWSVPGSECLLSPDGARAMVMRRLDDKFFEIRIYPIDSGTPGEPAVFPKEPITDHFYWSVSSSWWGDQPLNLDKIYDTSSSTCSPVPWDTTDSTFLGAPDESTAILIEVPYSIQHDSFPVKSGDSGAIVAVNRQGQELWRTKDKYVSGFLDPALPDLLIGYQQSYADDFSERFSATPHILDPQTGVVRSTLSSSRLFLASDGLICFSSHNSAAEAYTFDGQPAWTITGAFDKITFNGTPSLNAVHRTLTENDGSTALVAENGTALVRAADGTFSRGGTGASLKISEYSDGEDKDDLHQLALLSDGSGVLTQASSSRTSSGRRDDSGTITMLDTSTGAEAWSLSGYLLAGRPRNWSRWPPYSAWGMTCNSYRPAESLFIVSDSTSSSTVTCFTPAP